MAGDEVSETPQLFGKKLVRKLLIPLTIAVVAYAALLVYGDMSAVAGYIKRVPFRTLAVGLVVSAFSLVVRGLRWHVYLQAVRIQVPAVGSALVFLSGLAMTITPGKLGEILKALLLKERYDVPVARSAPIVIAERLMDLGALVALGLGGLLWVKSPAMSCAIGALIVLSLFAFGRSRRLGLWAVDLLTKFAPLKRYRDKLLSAHRSLQELWSVPAFGAALALSLLGWGLQAYTVVLFVDVFHPRALSLAGALVAYAAPLLAGSLAFLPAGLGLTEASMTGTLQALTAMPAAVAAGVTILTRLVTLWLAVGLGLAALAAWRAGRRAGRVASQ